MCLIIILSFALCGRLLLFLVFDMVVTLVAFMGEFSSLVLAQRLAFLVAFLLVLACAG